MPQKLKMAALNATASSPIKEKKKHIWKHYLVAFHLRPAHSHDSAKLQVYERAHVKSNWKATPLLIPSIWKLLGTQYHSWKC